MDSRFITRCLTFSRWRQSFMLPCYTPADWWECDLFEITKSGYFVEYEIKVSWADFFADAAKAKWLSGEQKSKHELLAARSTRGPASFWFVTPPGLLADNEIPEWAGLMEAGPTHFRIRRRKAAPRLHREKVSPKIESHARGICYYRMHGLLIGEKITDEPAREPVELVATAPAEQGILR